MRQGLWAFVILCTAVALAGAAAAAPPTPSLTGTWQGTNDDSTYQVTQTGRTVTWTAYSADRKWWCHRFTGTISGDIVEGDFQDLPACQHTNSGHIELRVVDANHMELVASSVGFGTTAWERTAKVTAPPRFNVTGVWRGTNDGSRYTIRQAGNTVTWSARSQDRTQWCHAFTGTISGDVIEGKFADSTACAHRASGQIRLRVVDARHMKLVWSSTGFGTRSWQRIRS